ncbi:MAG: hypothetical protein QNJ60_07435 [Xenococcaceae cyanobacterium MO_188.B19]|nr:hypothetical protein [Xenococcaceae cyanobacterium MO_188.B19]
MWEVWEEVIEKTPLSSLSSLSSLSLSQQITFLTEQYCFTGYDVEVIPCTTERNCNLS